MWRAAFLPEAEGVVVGFLVFLKLAVGSNSVVGPRRHEIRIRIVEKYLKLYVTKYSFSVLRPWDLRRPQWHKEYCGSRFSTLELDFGSAPPSGIFALRRQNFVTSIKLQHLKHQRGCISDQNTINHRREVAKTVRAFSFTRFS